ncbi:protein C19orf12 homolog [Archocentrus centrarchus]|uniref:protein C19orf12 homolog n=1 Tax=Archocentrus centrarchus TaxID=63155 RepID=UPI0011EA12D6|nr:protein C19orf12 homolog [Archocentrus centrarchus]
MEAKKDDVTKLIGDLSPDVEKQLRMTWKNVCRGALVTGGLSGVCALLGGPVGLAFGGIIGGIYSWMTSEEFKPLPQILMEMTPAQRDELFKGIMAVLGGQVWETASQLIYIVRGTPSLKKAVINVIIQKMFH